MTRKLYSAPSQPERSAEKVLVSASLPAEQWRQSHSQSIVKRFVELLTAHYRAEHKVEFYAKRLNLSTHYLTLTVTGRSVSDFIYWMLYSDARSLLNDSKLSVQQITTLLHFSDQSAFGKFFKRRSGLSPLDYRKKNGVNRCLITTITTIGLISYCLCRLN